MKILITGGTGFIGSTLCRHFSQQGFQVSVLTRQLNLHSSWLLENKSIRLITELSLEEEYEVIINLAGESLNKKRWNDQVKKNIYESRIKTTEKIINFIENAHSKPKLLISGSAIGFYGSHEDKIFTEDFVPTDNSFTHALCNDWEKTAMRAAKYGVRVCLIRTGIVLGENGGALKEMILPFKFGLGAKLGNGRQWMSWIHMDDIVGAIDLLIDRHDLTGPFNLTAPGAVTNKEFSLELGRALNRPCFLTLPNFLVGILFGEMGKALLLNGQRVVPHKLIEAGYQYKFPKLSEALREILS